MTIWLEQSLPALLHSILWGTAQKTDDEKLVAQFSITLHQLVILAHTFGLGQKVGKSSNFLTKMFLPAKKIRKRMEERN